LFHAIQFGIDSLHHWQHDQPHHPYYFSDPKLLQAVTDFGNRNHLPRYLQEQMIAHTRLKFKTESLQQQKTLETLPKAIRASLAQHLFLSTMEKVYLFQGTSSNLLTQLK
jgi:hypothetical protein